MNLHLKHKLLAIGVAADVVALIAGNRTRPGVSCGYALDNPGVRREMAGRFPDGEIGRTCIRAGRGRSMKDIERIRRGSGERAAWTAALMEGLNPCPWRLAEGRR